MSRPRRRLQNSLMLAFGSFAIVTASVFGLYAVVFMYSVEDSFFMATLDQEAAVQLRDHAASGQWSAPRDASMRLFRDVAAFPDDLNSQYVDEPQRREFPGNDSRHYHLKRIDPPAPAAPVWLVAEVSKQLVVRPIRDSILTLLGVSALVILLIALLVGYWLARRTARPLAQLADSVDRMSPNDPVGDFPRHFSDDEVGVLARGLAAMAGRVRTFIAREREFTRDASHELRTPLAVIRSAAERLALEPGLSAIGAQNLVQVRQSSQHLEQTVTMLLTLAREEQSDDVAKTPVAVLPILERVIVEQSVLLQGKDVRVDVAVAASTRLTLPAPALHILLSNLIGNAFAHTPSGSVRIDVEAGHLRIANSADGHEPVQRWEQPQAFNKRDSSGGYGLGLGIVRRLCDRHAIDLRIERANDGQTIVSIGLDRVLR